MANNNDKKVLNVPALRFPEFTGEWENITIREACSEFQSGKNIKAEMINDQGLYPVYGGNGLRGFTGSYNHDGDYILIGRQGALCGNVRKVTGKTYVTEHAIAVCASKEHETTFLQHLFQKMRLGQYSDQSAQPGLAVNKLLRLNINVPSKNEQGKIAKILSLIDERITTQNKIIEKLQSLIKGIVDELMTVLLKGELYPFASLYIKAGEGGTPTTSVSKYYSGGSIPFIKIDDLSQKYLTSNKDFITELGMQKSSAWLIPSQSVIYSNGATIGAISINKYPVCTKQGILGIVPNINVNVEYLYLLMSSSYFSKEVGRIITEGTMKTAYLKDINHIKSPLPSKAQQQNITNLTSSIEKKLSMEQNCLKFLKLQKQHLLRTMFI